MHASAAHAVRFDRLIGADAVASGDATRACAVDGMVPACVLTPASIEELSSCLAAADRAALAVLPLGQGTRLSVGNRPTRYDVALCTRRLCRIVAHEAADMTVTVQAGATLAEVNAVLARAGQHLPLDPPAPARTTIGGLIATDACGPLRLSQGKVRDLLIGITAVLADGTIVKGGGRVVKNVAGFDLMKLFTGSFGTLAVIVEATFKVRPRPPCHAVWWVPASDVASAVRNGLALLDAGVAPLLLEALDAGAATAVCMHHGAGLVVGCGGRVEEVAEQRQRVNEWGRAQSPAVPVHECTAAEADRVTAAVRDLRANVPALRNGDDGSARRLLGCKLSVLPSQLGAALAATQATVTRHGAVAALVAHAGCGVGYARVACAAPVNAAALAGELRSMARAQNGWVVFDLLPPEVKGQVDAWGFEGPALRLMRRIKQTLDPRARLSPGRFVGGI